MYLRKQLNLKQFKLRYICILLCTSLEKLIFTSSDSEVLAMVMEYFLVCLTAAQVFIGGWPDKWLTSTPHSGETSPQHLEEKSMAW